MDICNVDVNLDPTVYSEVQNKLQTFNHSHCLDQVREVNLFGQKKKEYIYI